MSHFRKDPERIHRPSPNSINWRMAAGIGLVCVALVLRLGWALARLQADSEPMPEVTTEQIEKSWKQYEQDRFRKAMQEGEEKRQHRIDNPQTTK